MPRPSANFLRASSLWLAVGFALLASAADKDKTPSLIGSTVEQVYSRLGEPHSVIRAGAREIMIFPKMKITFRNGIAVEAEDISDEPAPVRRPDPTPAPPPAPATADATDATKKTAATATPAPAPATPDPAAAKATEANTDSKTNSATTSNGGLEIKFVRPPSGTGVRSPTPKLPSKPPAVSPAPAPTPASAPAPTTVPATITAPARPMPATAKQPAPSTPTSAPVMPQNSPEAKAAAAAAAARAGAGAASTTEVKAGPVAAGAATEATEAANGEPEAKPKAKPKMFFRRRFNTDPDLPEASLFTTQTFIFGVALIGAVGYLIWRGRQRKLELAVTTVSNTPFDEAAVADNGSMFTPELLAKLEWKRFEELVALYYVKTGVIATRTKTGPESPVHLNISWKGETKPFACVQCHANPPSLIRPGPLVELFTALTKADIRRGYVVTNGRFNVEARDFAEEKHFTLLPGDLLLEKLNALPPAARAELMQATIAGDYSTPTCPKCDAKMTRHGEDGWRCVKCDVTLAAPKK